MSDTPLLLTCLIIGAPLFALFVIFLMWDNGRDAPRPSRPPAPDDPPMVSSGWATPQSDAPPSDALRSDVSPSGMPRSGMTAPRPTRDEFRRAQSLRGLLRDELSADDLRELCFRLDIDPDALPGAGQSSLARELVLRCRHTERLDELTELTLTLRPDLARRIEG